MSEQAVKQTAKSSRLPGIQHLRARSTQPGVGPATSDTYRGAFIVTAPAIQDIERHLQGFAAGNGHAVPGVIVTAQVFQKTIPPYQTTVEDLLKHRNPKAAPIYGLVLSVRTDDRMATVFIDSTGMNDRAAIGLSAQVKESAAADAVYTLLSAMDREAANMRDGAGHWHRRTVDCAFSWVRKHGGRIYAVFFVMWAVVVLGGFAATVAEWIVHRNDPPAPTVAPRAPTSVQPDTSTTGPLPDSAPTLLSQPKSFDWSLVRRVTVDVLIATGVIGVLVGYGWLFPRVSFVIGDGKERFDNFKWNRRFAVGSVIVCGLLLPFIRSIPIQPAEPSVKIGERR